MPERSCKDVRTSRIDWWVSRLHVSSSDYATTSDLAWDPHQQHNLINGSFPALPVAFCVLWPIWFDIKNSEWLKKTLACAPKRGSFNYSEIRLKDLQVCIMDLQVTVKLPFLNSIVFSLAFSGHWQSAVSAYRWKPVLSTVFFPTLPAIRVLRIPQCRRASYGCQTASISSLT